MGLIENRAIGCHFPLAPTIEPQLMSLEPPAEATLSQSLAAWIFGGFERRERRCWTVEGFFWMDSFARWMVWLAKLWRPTSLANLRAVRGRWDRIRRHDCPSCECLAIREKLFR